MIGDIRRKELRFNEDTPCDARWKLIPEGATVVAWARHEDGWWHVLRSYHPGCDQGAPEHVVNAA